MSRFLILLMVLFLFPKGFNKLKILDIEFSFKKKGKLVPSAMELVRLAIPRRTYTQSHMDYLAEVIISVFENRSTLKGLEIVYETQYLRHFTAKFKPV
ncbi:MAG: Tryptophanase [Mucilaginibacter sp.]|nr:Tryptophanase [Mucilaginibacter sp.]